MALGDYINEINWQDHTRPIYTHIPSIRGVVDYGKLLNFAPYEKGYCFLVVLSSPDITNNSKFNSKAGRNFKELQEYFVHILESDFKGLSGLEDYSTETYSIGIGNSQNEVISKVVGPNTSEITFNFTEKQGTPINKYLTEYFERVRDPYSLLTSYGVSFTGNKHHVDTEAYVGPYDVAHWKEVFNFLYVVTDSTCLNVEQAFLLLNAIPRNNVISDLYNQTRGQIESAEIGINFTCSVRRNDKANVLANNYLEMLVNTIDNDKGIIELNSYDFNYTLSGTRKSKENGSYNDPIKINQLIEKYGMNKPNAIYELNGY